MRVLDDAERRARLVGRHALAAPVASVEAAVEAVVCLHATEPANVYLAAAVRSGATRAQIDHALYADRTMVRQLAMRRTVFAFPRELLGAAWGSASARVARQLTTRLAKEIEAAGLADDGDAWLARVRAAVGEVLASGPATTAELRAAVPALDARLELAPGKDYGATVAIASRALGALAADGSLLRGDNDGGWKASRPRWTRAEDWLEPLPVPTAAREGYAVLVDRWLRRFGPGTEGDLAWWLGATKGAVRQALADVGGVTVELADGTPAHLHPEDTDAVAVPPPAAVLLPALDPTTMGWKQRDFYLDPSAEGVFDRNGNGGPTAWWDGRIVGGWTQDPDGAVVLVPLGRLPDGAAGPLAEAAAALTAWLDGEVVRSAYQSPLARAFDRERGAG